MAVTRADVASIVPCNIDVWMELKPLLFYKDGKPFGLIAFVLDDDVVIINSISKDNELFTFGMRKCIILTVRNNTKVMLMSTCKDSCLTRLLETYHEDGINSFFTKGF